MTTLTVMGVVATKASVLVGIGVCMGLGFWLSKKITNVVDERLLLYDSRKLTKLKEEMYLS